jgi:hypothetical protein
MAVGPIHHRGDGEAAGEWGGCGGDRGHWRFWVGWGWGGRSLSGLDKCRRGFDYHWVACGGLYVESCKGDICRSRGSWVYSMVLSVKLANMQKLHCVFSLQLGKIGLRLRKACR